ncbi:MAG: PEGA domain-containing protein [Lentisphaerae bacterium]|nr:PEGA domain-containing protein [Lentisphaerota bacterium]
MKKILLVLIACIACTTFAQPMKVLVLDFENKANLNQDKALIGGITAESLAAKGFEALAEGLISSGNVSLIDRRDFMKQTEAVQPEGSDLKVSFIRAAQTLNADIALKGALMSLSPSKKTVSVGGVTSESLIFTVRVTLEALSTHDGNIIAMKSGKASTSFRQTDVQQTTIGEDDFYDMLLTAINDAIPAMMKDLEARLELAKNYEKVTVSIKTDADPALVEIDGTLVGTTPIEKLAVYKGDHLITVGKPGYRNVSKRIMIEENTAFEIPMLRTELTADELKEVLEKMRLDVILGIPEPPIIIKKIQD